MVGGWWPILVRLDERLRAVEPSYQLTQVKQKFGSLDVHIKSPVTSDKIREELVAAEAESHAKFAAARGPLAGVALGGSGSSALTIGTTTMSSEPERTERSREERLHGAAEALHSAISDGLRPSPAAIRDA